MFLSRLCLVALLFVSALTGHAQTTSAASPRSTPIDGVARSSPSPSATPIVFLPQTLSDLKRLQQAALTSDYAYRQVAHLANNIGPPLSGSAPAPNAGEKVAA